jgi:hypothetical protein
VIPLPLLQSKWEFLRVNSSLVCNLLTTAAATAVGTVGKGAALAAAAGQIAVAEALAAPAGAAAGTLAAGKDAMAGESAATAAYTAATSTTLWYC